MIDADAHLEHIRAQFGRQADAYVRLRHTTDERSLNGLVLLSGADAESRVLDVACGPGFLTMAFAARCRHAVGFDATEPFLAMARAEAEHRGLRNVAFQCGNAEQLPFGSGEFDIAACRAAVHHFARPERVLAEMVRVTAPQGRIVVADFLSSDDPVKAAYHNQMERLCDPTHVRSLTTAELVGLFGGAGLIVRFQTEVTYDYELEEWMAHGGPDAATAAQIRALMEASIDADRSGLNVRRQDGGIWFSHRAVAYVLERAA
jgi:ubiquinone/menaquinone biosynthesis C-methylase UbiE